MNRTSTSRRAIRVLLVDDDEDDYLIIKKLAAKVPNTPFHIDWSDSIDRASQLIKQAVHDVYLIDYRLGMQTGLELLSNFDIVQRPEPFIILTGAGDEQVERTAMKMGAADYLVKNTLDSELLSRVLHYGLQRKFIEAQRVRQLVEVNRSKDEFIALASHQLRTPATAVKQYVGMILEGYAGTISEEQERFLRSAYESNERQIQVVNDILRVAKLDLQKIILKPKATDMTKLMDSILRDLASHYVNRQQKLTFNKSKRTAMAMIDPEYIRMALSNIVDNASKYTPEGKALTVSVGVSASQVTVTITDQGVGIAKADIDKLFRKFSRIDNPLSVKVGGTGLGLYWANEVVNLHNGSIAVQSTLGEGSSFIVSMPAVV